MKLRGEIFCAYSGTGKTESEKRRISFDLERTVYLSEDYDDTAEQAVKYARGGYIVTLGTNRNVRLALKKLEIPYTVVMPDISDKDNYFIRYSKRRDEAKQAHIRHKWDNWNRWLSDILEWEEVVTLPPNGFLADYLIEWKKQVGEPNLYLPYLQPREEA
jgi:hypothetical protein